MLPILQALAFLALGAPVQGRPAAGDDITCAVVETTLSSTIFATVTSTESTTITETTELTLPAETSTVTIVGEPVQSTVTTEVTITTIEPEYIFPVTQTGITTILDTITITSTDVVLYTPDCEYSTSTLILTSTGPCTPVPT